MFKLNIYSKKDTPYIINLILNIFFYYNNNFNKFKNHVCLLEVVFGYFTDGKIYKPIVKKTKMKN